jgi:hypothetical protein
MGIVLAIMVFVYPLALPLATLGAIFFVASSIERGLAVFAVRAAVVLISLVAVLSPGVATTGSGSFLHPWWLWLQIGQADVDYYGFHYAVACVLLLVMMNISVALFRVFVKRHSSPPRARPHFEMLEVRYAVAMKNAARLFLAGNPDSFACPACAGSIGVKSPDLSSVTNQRVVVTKCSCGKCSATINVESLVKNDVPKIL